MYLLKIYRKGRVIETIRCRDFHWVMPSPPSPHTIVNYTPYYLGATEGDGPKLCFVLVSRHESVVIEAVATV